MSHHSSTNHKTVLTMLAFAFLIGLFGLIINTPRVAHAATTFVVNTILDEHDSNPNDNLCSTTHGACSLRAALEEAFGVSSPPVTINFDSSLSSTTIYLDNALGQLAWEGDSITIDGGTRNITISGLNLGNGQSVFRIRGSNNLLRNLTIQEAPGDGIDIGDFGAGVGAGNNNILENLKVLGNGDAGIYLSGASGGGHNNTIRGSMIGSSYLSGSCLTSEANYYGILVDGAIGTKVGDGTSLNVIVCNTSDGVHIIGTGSTYSVTVNFNNIGTSGIAPLPNGRIGVYNEASNGTTIRNNVISGNSWAGVWISNSAYITISTNSIGTNSAGTAALPNGHDGIALTNGTRSSMIGGANAADRNIISGNTQCGVRIRDNSPGNSIRYNLIGLDFSGTAPIPNHEAGVAVFDAQGTFIGTSMMSENQYISGNLREGIYIQNASDTFIGQTEWIGVAADGTTPIGNGLEGVMLNGATNTFVLAWKIAHNGGAGVAVVGNTATGNMIEPAIVRNNGGLPIDLGNDGFTRNGSRTAPGPNNWINYPVITSSSYGTISGTACPNCKVFLYEAMGNPATPSGGGEMAGEATADATGNWTASVGSGLNMTNVTAVTCRAPCFANPDTSEMSPLWRTQLPLVIR